MRSIFMFCFIGFYFSIRIAFSQDVEVKNVIAGQNFKDIVVTYDLLSENESRTYTVSLHCSTDGGKVFGDPLKNTTGDVGFNIAPGEGKKITWHVLNEVNQFVYDDVVFKVRARENTGGFVDLVLVEGGSFIMGNENGQADEKPEHEVQLSNFYISRYEITVKQYKAFCKETGREMPESNSEWLEDHPMTYVSWDDAKAYCNWLCEVTGEKYRLPTEAEWEYVAKGGIHGVSITDATNNELDTYAWHNGNTGGYKHYEVGRLKPNVLGVYDIIGNVWEWCEDWYNQKYYSFSPKLNPIGPPSGKIRVRVPGGYGVSEVKVVRGFSYMELPEHISKTYRKYRTYSSQVSDIGFRVVKEP